MARKAKLKIVRAKSDEASFREVFDLLLELHKEGGYAALDPVRAAESCFRALSEGMVFVARLGKKAVGTIGLIELRFWYSQESFLQDAWLFVRPDHRKGTVGVELLRHARDEAEARNKIAFITVNNPDRRPKRTTAALESQVLGYVPVGHTMKVSDVQRK